MIHLRLKLVFVLSVFYGAYKIDPVLSGTSRFNFKSLVFEAEALGAPRLDQEEVLQRHQDLLGTSHLRSGVKISVC